STASQNSPGAALVKAPLSGSRARPKRTSTSTANGATWLVATRERSSMRRALPATSAASRHMDLLHGTGPRRQHRRPLLLVADDRAGHRWDRGGDRWHD